MHYKPRTSNNYLYGYGRMFIPNRPTHKEPGWMPRQVINGFILLTIEMKYLSINIVKNRTVTYWSCFTSYQVLVDACDGGRQQMVTTIAFYLDFLNCSHFYTVIYFYDSFHQQWLFCIFAFRCVPTLSPWTTNFVLYYVSDGCMS